MPRVPNLRSPSGHAALEQHPLQQKAPVMAEQVAQALGGHLVRETSRSYGYLTARYVDFCALYDLPPWPADPPAGCVRLGTSTHDNSKAVLSENVFSCDSRCPAHSRYTLDSQRQ